MQNKQGRDIMESEEFHLGDILSVITGRMVSPCADGLYKLLEFISGPDFEKLNFYCLTRKCRHWLFEQHPQLKTFKMKNEISLLEWSLLNVKNKYKRESIILEWIGKQVQDYGLYLEVTPIPQSKHLNFIQMLDTSSNSTKIKLPLLTKRAQ